MEGYSNQGWSLTILTIIAILYLISFIYLFFNTYTLMEKKNWIYICHYGRGTTSISDPMTLDEAWACLEVVVKNNRDCINAQILCINE
jgi:hypothetical protein